MLFHFQIKGFGILLMATLSPNYFFCTTFNFYKKKIGLQANFLSLTDLQDIKPDFAFGSENTWECGVEVLRVAFDLPWIPRAASTLTRFWNKINTQALAEQMGERARRFV
ncbi:MAG: hypothetical protein JRI22_21715, partial [Deltaproteobacteria bacterium]|nr:hypothetical protein [Deltaproteobacteria bacterium]